MYYLAMFATVLLIIISLILATIKVPFVGSEYLRYTLIYTPTTLMLIYLVTHSEMNIGTHYKLLSSRPLVSLGDLSTYAFLIHIVCIRFCNAINAKFFNLNIILVAIVAFILTLISTVVWIRFEAIVRNKLKNKACVAK
ncbi:MAG: hypothetical protein J6U86_02615, partial [Clostridia bacterium]|nr:hypothetical protein [Clostridia bacterium]